MFNTKKGFTRIEHPLYNWLISAKLGGPELKIVHAIIRRTNGYGRSEALIALRLFEKMTGIGRRNVWTYLKKLLNKRVILRKRGPKTKYGKPVYYYSINKELCHLEYVRTGIDDTLEPAVNDTSNKETNINLNKEIGGLVDNMNMKTV